MYFIPFFIMCSVVILADFIFFLNLFARLPTKYKIYTIDLSQITSLFAYSSYLTAKCHDSSLTKSCELK